MALTPRDIGCAVRQARRNQGLRQDQLAAAANVGVRFISELESGKATAQMGKTLAVTHALGLTVSISEPKSKKS
jgi:y4mF family transcriptional regulator